MNSNRLPSATKISIILFINQFSTKFIWRQTYNRIVCALLTKPEWTDGEVKFNWIPPNSLFEHNSNEKKCFVYFTGTCYGGSRRFLTDFLQEFPTPGTGPYFDSTVPSNITGLVGKNVHLVCKVKNLGNRTVSFQSACCVCVVYLSIFQTIRNISTMCAK